MIALGFSPDGQTLAAGGDRSQSTLTLWEVVSREHRASLGGHHGQVTACAFSPDGQTIATASGDTTLKLWDAVTGTERATLAGHSDWVMACAFSPDGRTIVSGSRDKTLKLWDAETGVERATLVGHTGWVNACAFAPDGRTIVSASDDATLRLWDAATGAERTTLAGHARGVDACAFSPDGRTIVSGSRDMTLKLWDAAGGAERATYAGHAGVVAACAFSPDGLTIVSGSHDGTLRIWDAETGAALSTLAAHADGVHGCAFSPDGQTIASATEDGAVKLWEASSGAELAIYEKTVSIRGEPEPGTEPEPVAQETLEGAMALLKEQERICRELNDPAGLKACLADQAVILSDRGDLEGAMALFQEQERICHELNDPADLQACLGNQSNILHDRGDLGGAMALLDLQERICRELGDQAGLQACLGNQALILKARGDVAEAVYIGPAGIVEEPELELVVEEPDSQVLDEDVQFTVYRPKVVRPVVWYPLLAFVHKSTLVPQEDGAPPLDPIAEVQRAAEKLLGEAAREYRDTTADATQALPRGSELRIVPAVPGFEFDPPSRSVVWVTPVHHEEFQLRASADLDGQMTRGVVSVYLGPLLIAEVTLSIRVDSSYVATPGRDEQAMDQCRPSRRIFVSYSHKDTEVVEWFESVASVVTVVTDDEFLRDVRILRDGEDWEEPIMRKIHEADVFQLFWSWNSMESQFVRQEWEYALSLAKPDFVRPVYWHDPMPQRADEGLPPPELTRLQFRKLPVDDRTAVAQAPLAGVAKEKAEAEGKTKAEAAATAEPRKRPRAKARKRPKAEPKGFSIDWEEFAAPQLTDELPRPVPAAAAGTLTRPKKTSAKAVGVICGLLGLAGGVVAGFYARKATSSWFLAIYAFLLVQWLVGLGLGQVLTGAHRVQRTLTYFIPALTATGALYLAQRLWDTWWLSVVLGVFVGGLIGIIAVTLMLPRLFTQEVADSSSSWRMSEK